MTGSGADRKESCSCVPVSFRAVCSSTNVALPSLVTSVLVGGVCPFSVQEPTGGSQSFMMAQKGPIAVHTSDGAALISTLRDKVAASTGETLAIKTAPIAAEPKNGAAVRPNECFHGPSLGLKAHHGRSRSLRCRVPDQAGPDVKANIDKSTSRPVQQMKLGRYRI